MAPPEKELDPSQNYLERPHMALDAFFNPCSIALIGASQTPHSVGKTLSCNLLETGFSGKVYFINNKRNTILGRPCWPDIRHIPGAVDLAVIATPAATLPSLIADCGEKGVKAAIVISAGFGETGKQGAALQSLMLQNARAAKMRLIGPNCLGLMNPHASLNATFSSSMALAGNTAFISQSGAMCTAVLDWSLQEKIGFSAFVSIGAMADVQWGDIITYLGNDPATHNILLYMESIGNARAFLSAAREVALTKPIIVIKPGKTLAAARAAASHTGSLAGCDEVFDAAMERVGVLRVNSIAELFDMALVLSKQPRPKGPRLAIITNAGGPGVLATDAALTSGAELACLQKKTIDELDAILPPAWSRANPIDLLGDAGPLAYFHSVKIAAKDENVDGLLVVLTPQDMTEPQQSAEKVLQACKGIDKPLLCSWMGGQTVAPSLQFLNHHNIPAFPYSDAAARAFSWMYRYSAQLDALYQTPQPLKEISSQKEKREKARAFLQKIPQDRTLLSEDESKELLEIYGIPIVKTLLCRTQNEAVLASKQTGYPCVVKLHSHTITHKSDVGGVRLNLQSESEVAQAYHEIEKRIAVQYGTEHFLGVTVQTMICGNGVELIVGSSVDEQFGPTILFGSGGRLVEIYRDRALTLPPLNATLARRLVEKTKISAALKGVRGMQPLDMHKLDALLVGFAQMLVDLPQIKECDINPLLAVQGELIALDARIVLFSKHEAASPLAIRPYPYEYIGHTSLKNSQPVTLRPICSEDEPALRNFHQTLSEHSVRQRYMQSLSLDERTAHDQLLRICFSDFDRDISFVALKQNVIIALGRLRKIPPSKEAALTLVVSDAYQNQGLGSALLQKLLDVALLEGIECIQASVGIENKQMVHLLQNQGFTIKSLPALSGILHAERRLLALLKN